MLDQEVRRIRARAEEELRDAIRQTLPLESLGYRAGRPRIAEGAEEHLADWHDAAPGTRWGGTDAWATFKAVFRVPEAWAGAPVELALPVGGQGIAYLDGQPWQGLDGQHPTIMLPPSCRDGRPHEVLIETYAVNQAPRRDGETCVVEPCGLRQVDAEARAYGYDLLVGADTLRVLPADHPARTQLQALLLMAEGLVDRRRPGSSAHGASRREARAVLAEGLPRLAAEWAAPGQVLATGHAHIDTAWKWTVSQTRRKVARSWSTALRLMEAYPEYHFLASQVQHYAWLEEDEPALYRQVEARVREGRWEPAAAMWVEPDVNLTSGESLARQLLYGQRAIQARFGLRCGILWLPDTFGYSAALPQLMRSAGVHTMVTSKLSWNDTNAIPHDTFRWRGLDGTEVLAYLLTARIDWSVDTWLTDPEHPLRGVATYNAHVTPYEVSSAWEHYRDKAQNDTVLYPFGHGDGGGGPTADMLEKVRRMAAYPGFPRLTPAPAGPFLQALHDRLFADPETPVWDGELYLEHHRGVYTSQAGVKSGNRRGEHALHDAEVWAAWAASHGAAGIGWHAFLAKAWELLLLNQFHDILPGSSIGEVYRDQAQDHARVQVLAGRVRHEAQTALAAGMAGPEDRLVLFSSLPWERADVAIDAALVAGHALLGHDGEPLPTQEVTTLDGRRQVLVGGLGVPALGYRAVPLGRAAASPANMTLVASERQLENRFFLLELDDAGQISRLYDKRHRREVLLPGGRGNRLQAFEDKPNDADAWDINSFYTRKSWDLASVDDWTVVEQGPLRAGVELRREWDGSTITQRILLHAELPRIDFQTRIDWHHHQVLLKAAFPLAVRNMNARYECAFGWVERPTHRNTSWDQARFEVAAHRWADLSEAAYGVSLLNDSKYGHDCLGGTLRLTLLKSGIDPDPEADQGIQHCCYALWPHGPAWTVEETVQAAYALNLPITALRATGGGGSLPASQSLVTTSGRHAVIDTVKPAEDGEGIIVRVYDCAGGRQTTELVFCSPIMSAQAVTVLEEQDTAAPAPQVDGNRMTFALRTFGVHSFRVRLAHR
ncbi:MAG TPA: glycoside hydrolase family 38 C-terminal domain-containing protein [Chloroflexota bacterium]|nr:glycoside hydrolase family 38 C-terminal domain-containing protein [Chloroflexota bacterium]